MHLSSVIVIRATRNKPYCGQVENLPQRTMMFDEDERCKCA